MRETEFAFHGGQKPQIHFARNRLQFSWGVKNLNPFSIARRHRKTGSLKILGKQTVYCLRMMTSSLIAIVYLLIKFTYNLYSESL